MNTAHHMKALNLLRNVIFLLFFCAAAASATASEGTLKPRKPAQKQAVQHRMKAPRKQVAPFVDPTLPLTELVERVRLERTR